MRRHSWSAAALSPSNNAWHQAPVWISITGAPNAAAVSICLRIGGDEQRHPDVGGAERRDPRTEFGALTGGVEAAFGGAFGAALGHQAGGMRPRPHRDVGHLRRRRHFEIERLVDLGLEPRDVVVADVAAILAQMRGDAVGAGMNGELRRADRIGMPPAAGVADGGDVIDVDA